MKTSAKHQIAITTATLNVLLLIITLGAFTFFTRYLLIRNLNSDLLIEAEEIVTQHITIENERITYINSTSDQTIEQDLLTDRLSSMIVNKNSTSIGKFGIFTKSTIPKAVDTDIRNKAKETCEAQKYAYAENQELDGNQYNYLYYPVLKDKTCYGTIIVAGDTKSIADIYQLMFTLSIVAVAFATVFNLLVGRTVATRILKPLHLLSARMQQVNLDTATPALISPYSRNDEISALIENFNTMAKRVSETALVQKSFIVDASHELKTPIARVVTDLDLIKLELRDVKAKPELHKSIDQAQADLSSIANIINALLQATKLKQVSLTLVPHSLAGLINAELTSLTATYHNSKIEVHSLLSNELALVDKEVFSLIIRNCLVNAFKYNILNGYINIKAELVGNTYTLTIKNTTAREGYSHAKMESYKLGFDIIRNLCAISKYDFTAKNEGGSFTITVANIPQGVILKRS